MRRKVAKITLTDKVAMTLRFDEFLQGRIMAIDGDDLAENAANKTIEKILDSIYTPIANRLGTTYARFYEDFGPYFHLTYRKCSNVRTILSAGKSARFEDIYEPLVFRGHDGDCSDNALADKIKSRKRVVLKGPGGAGKTVFFKYFWLSCLADTTAEIPLFVELRRLNDITSLNLSAFLRTELNASRIFSDAVFEEFCIAGKFIFILDGFDEILRSKRTKIERQIIDLAYAFPRCAFVVSSRDDDRFKGWGDFETFEAKPLDLGQCRALVSRIDFEESAKKNFLDILTEEFHQEYQHFLDRPLLTLMMLLTFYQNLNIPDRLSTFYRNAYTTLLIWHEATKETGGRDRFLDEERFRVAFATFCFISYWEPVYEFESDRLSDFIRKTVDYLRKVEGFEEIDYSNLSDLKLDFWQSANLLQRDGSVFLFLHRSFQEYFAAEFAMTVLNSNLRDVLAEFARRTQDNSLMMAYELQSDRVIDEYVAPVFEELVASGLFDLNEDELFFGCGGEIEVTYGHPENSEGWRQMGVGKFFDAELFSKLSSLAKLCKSTFDASGVDFTSRLFLATGDCSVLLGSGYKLHVRQSGPEITRHLDLHLSATRSTRLSRREMNAAKEELRNSIVERVMEMATIHCKELRELKAACVNVLDKRSTRKASIDDILGL